jgi:class 3 adenylate cyclase
VHEEDALRAVRAALDLRTRIDTDNEEIERSYGVRLALRTGVMTGEVFVGAGDVFATGDAVNVAARLEQAAAPGDVLIGEPTWRPVRGAVRVERLEPLPLKGKAEPVAVWKVRGLVADERARARRLDSSLTGRDRELQALLATSRTAVKTRT